MRYLLTDIGGSAQRTYERIHCLRGNAENRLKELKAGPGLDRTSCHRFLANQFRVLLAAAYVLLQELRWQARGTAIERAQLPRQLDFLLKIAVWVNATMGRVVLHLSRRGCRRKRSGLPLPAGREGRGRPSRAFEGYGRGSGSRCELA